MSDSRCPFLCVLLLVCLFAATPAQPEEWARDLTTVELRKQALSQLTTEQAQLQAEGNNVALVKNINRIVEVHLMLSDFDAALAAANDARARAEQFRNSESAPLLVDTLTLVSRVYIRRDENRLALPLLQDALALSRNLQYLTGEAESLAEIGAANFELSKLEEAEQSTQDALTIWQALQDKRGEARTLITQADIHGLAGNIEQATTELRRAESLWRELNDSVQLAT
ncbi:MAG TPA: hypothetical protein VFM05_01435, partial [Candidatus Saccharimonadales bacterium]|nr:hypothetical protein [Candidatus Saccharimonadales bacterium]